MHQRTMNTIGRRTAVLALTLGAGAGVLALGGCYERVVGARGLGADQYTISEPYQENSKVDDWLFGEKPTNKPMRRLPSSAQQ